MTMIPAFRSQGPASGPTTPAKPETGPRAPAVVIARPVSDPIRMDALGQVAASTGILTSRLAERDESHHPAAEARIAADAARKAYIKASIAAGVSPLPMP
jgi:hypothetical protein